MNRKKTMHSQKMVCSLDPRRKKKPRLIPIIILGIYFLTFFVDFHAVSAAQGTFQEGDCLNILREAAGRMGIEGEELEHSEDINAETGKFICRIFYSNEINEHPNSLAREEGKNYYFVDNVQMSINNYNSQLISSLDNYMSREAVTFHGYEANYAEDTEGGGIIKAIEWFVPGPDLQFDISRWVYEYSDDGFSQNLTFDIRSMAEVFYAVAYNRLPELGMNPPDESALEGAQVEGMEEQLGEMPVGMEETAAGEGNAGNMVMPISGAFLGALAAFALSNASTLGSMFAGAGTSTPQTMVTEQGEELYWSERPWDEAGPGYVTKAEYEQTQQMMAQGYQWTKDGWQLSEQMEESARLAENNREALAQEDGEWRTERKQQLKELRENAEELKKRREELDAVDEKLLDLKIKMSELNDKLKEENYYVQNPYQEDLVPIRYGLSVLKNIAWDNTVGLYTKSKGIRCEDYVDKTLPDIKEAVQEIYGEEAEVVPYKFDEKSSIMPRSGWNLGAVKDWCDSWRTDNHILVEVKLPDKTELSVDLHQKNLNKRSDIVQPMSKDREHWKGIIGEDEFYEGITGI
jgi:Skp family chaperone for outer membrane proteins